MTNKLEWNCANIRVNDNAMNDYVDMLKSLFTIVEETIHLCYLTSLNNDMACL